MPDKNSVLIESDLIGSVATLNSLVVYVHAQLSLMTSCLAADGQFLVAAITDLHPFVDHDKVCVCVCVLCCVLYVYVYVLCVLRVVCVCVVCCKIVVKYFQKFYGTCISNIITHLPSHALLQTLPCDAMSVDEESSPVSKLDMTIANCIKCLYDFFPKSVSVINNKPKRNK